MASTPPRPLLRRCRDITSYEIDVMFREVTRRIVDCPLVTSYHALVKELANNIEVRLGTFCLTTAEEMEHPQYLCYKHHVTQEQIVNHLFDLFLSLNINHIL